MAENSLENVYRMNNYYRRMKIVKRVISHIVLIIFAIFAVFPIYYVFITPLNSIGSLAEASLSDITAYAAPSA